MREDPTNSNDDRANTLTQSQMESFTLSLTAVPLFCTHINLLNTEC